MMILKKETTVRTFLLLFVCTLFAKDTNFVITAVNAQSTNDTTVDEPDSQYFCNICGASDYIMLDTKGIVTIDYNNKTLKDSCLDWQKIALNPIAMTEDFCRNRMPSYTINACKCATSDGSLLTDIKQDEGEKEGSETESGSKTEATTNSGGKRTMNTALVFWISLVSFYITEVITGYAVCYV